MPPPPMTLQTGVCVRAERHADKITLAIDSHAAAAFAIVECPPIAAAAFAAMMPRFHFAMIHIRYASFFRCRYFRADDCFGQLMIAICRNNAHAANTTIVFTMCHYAVDIFFFSYAFAYAFRCSPCLRHFPPPFTLFSDFRHRHSTTLSPFARHRFRFIR